VLSTRKLEANTMKVKWALLIPFITMIIAIAPNTTYATESQPKLEENADFFIAKLTRLRRVTPPFVRRINQANPLAAGKPA
jgi:hypothetical protein